MGGGEDLEETPGWRREVLSEEEDLHLQEEAFLLQPEGLKPPLLNLLLDGGEDEKGNLVPPFEHLLDEFGILSLKGDGGLQTIFAKELGDR